MVGYIHRVVQLNYMSEDEFTRLFKYMEKRFNAVDKQFEQNHAEHRNMLGAIAELGGQIKEYH